MNFKDLLKPRVLDQPTYEPGKPISYVAREFGLQEDSIIKLASNENPLGTSPLALEAAGRALDSVWLYPDGGTTLLRDKIANTRELAPEQIILGNGSNEIIELLGHAFLDEGDEVIMGAHAFIVYKLVTLLFGATPVEVPMPNYTHDLEAMREAVGPKTRLMFLPSPNNPTGTANSREAIQSLIESLPDHVILVFDEAYAEYLEDAPDLRPAIDAGHKVICLRTFSKIYGMAGFRIGYGYGNPEVIALLNRVRQPFNVNTPAQEAAMAALDDHKWVKNCQSANAEGLKQLEGGFGKLGLTVVPSAANFVLVELDNEFTAKRLFTELQKRGIIVRPVAGYGLPRCLRVSVGTPDQNQRVLKATAGLLEKVEQAG